MDIAPKPPDERERLETLASYCVLDTDPEEGFDAVAQVARLTFDTPIALVSLIDETRQWFKSHLGLDARETPRDFAFCAHVVFARDALVVKDATANPRFADNPLVTGPPHVVFYAGAPLRTSDGKIMGSLCVIDHVPRDPTDKQLEVLGLLAQQVVALLEMRRTAQELTEADVATRESESRFRTLSDMSSEGIAISVDGTIVDVNRSLCELLQCTRDELVGRSPSQLASAGCQEHLAAYLERRSDEPAAAIEVSVGAGASPVLVTTKETLWESRPGLVTILRGLSSEREMQRLEREFISIVSHELRTPLTSIKGSMALLDEGVAGELPERVKQLVGIARQNADRLVRLVNDILDLEKLRAGRFVLQTERVDAKRLLEMASAAIHGMARDREIEILIRVPPAPTWVCADTDRIVQVLVNLLSNAVKFSPTGSRVQLRLREVSGGALRLEVVDDGPGVEPQDVDRIFEPFQQIEAGDARAHGGTGLGLAISRAIVREHGGDLGVDSKPGAGSTFWIELAAS